MFICFVGIRWSKIRERIESFLCPELQGKVRYCLTTYHQTDPPTGRGWIEFKGEELWSFASQNNDRQRYFEAVEGYPRLSIEEALQSENPVIRGIALLDRRLGKRRLREIRLTEAEHGFVHKMFELRSMSSRAASAERIFG